MTLPGQLSLLDYLDTPGIKVGDIVRTSYGTGPYRILEIVADCTCPNYMDSIDHYISGKTQPSPEHFHLTLVHIRAPKPSKDNLYYLNGYAEMPDGRFRSVWSDDELFVEQETSR